MEQIRVYEMTENGASWTGIMLTERVQILDYLAHHSAENRDRTFFAATVELRKETIEGRLKDTATITRFLAYALNGRAQVR